MPLMIILWNSPPRDHHQLLLLYFLVVLGKWILSDELHDLYIIIAADFVNRIHISLYLLYSPVLPFSQNLSNSCARDFMKLASLLTDGIACQQFLSELLNRLRKISSSVRHLRLSLIFFYSGNQFRRSNVVCFYLPVVCLNWWQSGPTSRDSQHRRSQPHDSLYRE